LIELLVARTVVRSSSPTLLPMANGAASIPKMTGGATSAYLGEGDNIEPSQQTFGMVLFKARKLATLVPISNDLLRINAANADTIVQDDMASSMARREDLAFLRGDGGEHEPKGMFNHVPTANKFDANSTVNLANVTVDLGKAILLLMEGHSRMLRPTWFMAPRTLHYLSTVRDGNGNYAFRDEVLAGRLWNYPLRWTTQIPVNLGTGTDESWILLVDMADAVLADEMDMEFAFSSTATYYDGAQLRSGFSRDESVIRVISKHDFNIRHGESFALIEAVTWGT
jgi:HK97 family phage major capsid protein